MKVDKHYEKLIRIARNCRSEEQVPYAFEKRIMARLAAVAHMDPLAWWAARLWKAATPCLVVTVLAASWSLLAPDSVSSDDINLSADLEGVVYASLENHLPAELNW